MVSSCEVTDPRHDARISR